MSDWKSRAERAEAQADALEQKLTRLTALVRQNQQSGLLGLSPSAKRLQAHVEAQQAQIDELERYLSELTGVLEQQSAQLAQRGAFCRHLGQLDADLDTALRTEVQALNQAKTLRGARPVVDASVPAGVQACIDYLYHFVLEVNIFARRADEKAVERHVARLLANEAGDVAHETDPHVVANTLLVYFQRLQQPYLPNAPRYIELGRERLSDQMRAFKLHEEVNKLPPKVFATAKELFGLLAEIAKEHETNRMPADRLAEIWGLVLWRDSSAVTASARCMVENDTFVFEKARKNRVFKEGKDPLAGQTAWKQYDQHLFARGNIGNKAARAGQSGI